MMIEALLLIAIFSLLGYTLGPYDEDLIDIERD
jgi:hypothetical protein